MDYYSFKRTVTEHEADWLIHLQRYDDWLLIGKGHSSITKEDVLTKHGIHNAINLGKCLYLLRIAPLHFHLIFHNKM